MGVVELKPNNDDMNPHSSICSLTHSHQMNMNIRFEVHKPSEIEDSRVINKMAERSSISQDNSIWLAHNF